jgi:hypothetical protein
MSHSGTVKQALLNKREQSRLKSSHVLVVEMWMVLIQNLKGYHIWQSSNVKLFGAQRIRETAKPLQFLEWMKATFDCGGNTTQRSVGVRRYEGNSLDPRKDDFLKLMMQSLRVFFFLSFFPQEKHKTGLFVRYDLLREEVIKKARSVNIPQSCGVGRRYAKRSVA